MPLVKMSQLLKEAKDKEIAIGSFSIINIETIMGTIQAAEALNASIIMQIAQPRLKYMPFDFIAPVMVKAAKEAKVNVAVHLDHAEDLELIKKSIEYGFTSVMIDASHYPFDKNVEITKKVVEIAHSQNADCEAEIGMLAQKEDGSKNENECLTDVHEAFEFALKTGVDALAVAIGNQHGLHAAPPKLNLQRLKEIHEKLKTPLVLHGGSGTSNEEFQFCIKNGIRKINVATATLKSVLEHAENYFKHDERDYFKFHQELINGAYESVFKHIKIFGV